MNYFFTVCRQWAVVWGLLCTQIALGQIPQSEFDALKKFYNATNGDGWTNRTGWENINTTATANDVDDTWQGITVAGEHVTQIQFNRNNLVGTIPHEIGDLPQLVSLRITNNSIAGSIPATVGKLTALTSLGLSNNTLTGAIPPEVGNLTQLVVLSLYGNKFTGTLPTELQQLTQLKSLSLGDNQLEGAIPSEIEHLVLLETLSLRSNQFTSLPASISQLVNLNKLYLQDNRLATLPKEIGSLGNLEELNLEDNRLQTLPAEIGDLTNLTQLHLGNNQLTSIPSELGDLTRIRRLELQDNQLTSLPNFSGKTSFRPTLFWVQNNALQFEHILLNRLKVSSYTPQSKYTISSTTITINDGENLNISGLVNGGSDNRYQWFKDGSSIGITSKSTNPLFVKNNIASEDAGTYVCKVTNSKIPGLTIESHPVTVNVIDKNGPLLKSTFPSNQQEMSIDLTSLRLTFTEKIHKGTGELLIKHRGSDRVVQRIAVSATADIGSSLIVSIAVLPEGHYYIILPRGFVKDVSGNLFAGIHHNSAWSFIINKNERPIIESLVPADNSTHYQAASLTSLTITFSEEVQKGSGYVRIKKASSGELVQLINVRSNLVTINGKTVNIRLDGLLTDEVSYYVTLPSAAVQDVLGNDFTGINDQTTWNFSLGTPAPPTLVQTVPIHQGTNVQVNISPLKMIFSEKIVKGRNGAVVIKKVANDEEVLAIAIGSSQISVQDQEVAIQLGQFLEPNTQYYMSIPSGTFQDEAGLVFAGITDQTTWQFTTGASQVPLVETLSPAHQSTVQAVFNTLTIHFSEDIQKGGGFVEIYNTQDDLVDFISVASSNVVVEGRQAVITFNATKLEPNTSYYVTIPSSAFTNVRSNAFAGFEKGQWEFNTTVVSGLTVLPSQALQVYPNPTTDIIYLTLNHHATDLIRFEAIDTQGKVIARGTLEEGPQKSIRIAQWPKGSYLLRLYTKNATIVKRIVKA